MAYTTENETLESRFLKLQTFHKSVKPFARNHDRNMTRMNMFMRFAADWK